MIIEARIGATWIQNNGGCIPNNGRKTYISYAPSNIAPSVPFRVSLLGSHCLRGHEINSLWNVEDWIWNGLEQDCKSPHMLLFQLISIYCSHFWLPNCGRIRDDIEKEDAFRGLCAMVCIRLFRLPPTLGLEMLSTFAVVNACRLEQTHQGLWVHLHFCAKLLQVGM